MLSEVQSILHLLTGAVVCGCDSGGDSCEDSGEIVLVIGHWLRRWRERRVGQNLQTPIMFHDNNNDL